MGTTLTVSKETFKHFFGKKSGTDLEICELIRNEWGLLYPITKVEWY